jgi:dipeptidyl aminopeptidase/acylaminoacyl peptidase
MLAALLMPGASRAQEGGFATPPGRIVVGDENGLYTVQADGSSQTYLVEEDDPNCWLRDGAWSPDGTRLLYTSICGGDGPTYWVRAEGRSASVFIYDLRSGESQLLLEPEEPYQDYAGDWYPDGEQVVIYSDRGSDADSTSGLFNVFRVDIASGESTQITDLDSSISRVSFDPTGRYLLYNRKVASAGNLDFEVRAFDLETESEIRVAAGFTPNWSPDGQWIAFATEKTPTDIFVMPADCIYSGGGCNPAADAHNITYTPDIAEREPVFSPDQSQVIYVRNTSPNSGEIVWDLYRQELRTGLLQNMTETASISERHRAWERISAVSRENMADALPVIVRVNTSQGSANLREAPNTNANIVGQVSNGQIVFVQGHSADGGWYKVTLPDDGSQAWLFGTLAAAVEGDPDSTPQVLE